MVYSVGAIQLNDELDVNEFRNKAFNIFLKITGCEFIATRCVLSISNNVKAILSLCSRCKVDLRLHDEASQIELTFILNPKSLDKNQLNDLILEGNVDFKEQNREWAFLFAFPKKAFQLDELIDLFNTKTRDQLLHEIQIKNADLKETLIDLEQSQADKEKAQKHALEKLEEINRMRKEANKHLEQQVCERTKEIESQKAEIEEKNKDILRSIQYAKRIQNAILPEEEFIQQILPDSFVFYQPKDIVSGDFFSVESLISKRTGEKVVLFCVADCTGHGVPGAFMSLIGNNFLKLSYSNPEVNSPAEILHFINEGIHSTLKKNGEEKLRDGMDIAICAFHEDQQKLFFAGAKNPLFLIKDGELIEFKGDKHPIGSYVEDELQQFTNQEIAISGGECLYIFSDGFPDQFGGPFGKKFLVRKFKELLLSIHHLPMIEQQELLAKCFSEWRGDLEQVDDICVFGTRL
jgi:serine phosphatase RsbU (regulator of sigma subunit)